MSALAALALALAAPAPALQPVTVPAAPVQQSFARIMDAVDACLAGTSRQAIDIRKLAALGWTEKKIEGIDQSKDPYRLFASEAGGAVILFNFGDGNVPHCHVLVPRTSGSTDSLLAALADHLGGPFLPGDQGLGEGARVMRVPGRPFLLALRPYADDKDFLGEIHVMPVEDEQ